MQNDDSILVLQLGALDKAASHWWLAMGGMGMMIYSQWTPNTALGLTIWMVALTAVIASALGCISIRRNGYMSHISAQTWMKQVRWTYFSAGLLWGSAACWLTRRHPRPGFGRKLHCSRSRDAFRSLCVYRQAFNLFQLPIFTGGATGFALTSSEFSLLLAGGAVMLGTCATMISRSLGDQLVTALQFSVDNKMLADRLAHRSAELETLNRKLEIESHTDPLTGVANRRRLMSFARALRGSYALIVTDVDFFKSYNDQYGHAEGDACLVAVADALKTSVRPERDLIARLGGEEFVIVLPETRENEAAAVAESIRTKVSALADARPARVKRSVTISMGVAATCEKQAKTLVTVMQEADTALYQAKSAGRNRVMTGNIVASVELARA